MAAIISGNELGLTTNPLTPRNDPNTARPGQSDQVYINSATGNLVIQAKDEYLATLGPDLALIRTYNAQGQFTDDNQDNWRLSVNRRVYGVTGTVNTAGSTITKEFGDGAQITYSYANGIYISTAGDGAHDTLAFNDTTQQWTWTDGSTQASETYNDLGQLIASRDPDQNLTTYGYTGNLLTQITDPAGQVTALVYSGTNLQEIEVTAAGQLQTLTRYTYDTQNRLSQVTVDLSPEDNTVADGNTYVTTYTYEGTSARVKTITQGDGASVLIEYDAQGRVQKFTDGAGKATTFAYDGAGTSTVTFDANSAVLSDTELVPTEKPVAPYYIVQAGQTWGDVTLAIYGVDTPEAIEALRTALGNDGQSASPLAGSHLTVPLSLVYGAAPATVANANTTLLLDTETETVTITVAPYYTVLAGDTWAAITQAIYGTTDPAAASALQAALGLSAVPAAGTHLTVPGTLSYIASEATVAANASVLSTTETATNTVDYTLNQSALTTPNPLATIDYALNATALQGNIYDDAGRLIGSLDSAGQLTTYTYDAAGNPLASRAYTAAPAPALMAQDFSSGTGGLDGLPGTGIYAVQNGRLAVTSPNAATTNYWNIHGTTDYGTTDATGVAMRAEITTDAVGAGELVAYGAEQNIAGSRDRGHWAVFHDGTLSVGYYTPSSYVEPVLGALSANTTYVVEVVTNNAGSTLYVYEKGTDRSAGYIDYRADTNWSTAHTFIGTNDGPSQTGGQIYLDNLSESTALGALVGNVIAVESPSDVVTAITSVPSNTGYYTVKSGDTWASIAQTFYGHAGLGDELQAALGDPPLTAGAKLGNLPANLASSDFFLDEAALTPATTPANILTDTGIAASQGQGVIYTFEVPEGATNLIFQTSGGTADADLYVRYGTPPTTSTYDFISGSGSNEERVVITTPAAGTWYALVNPYTAISGVNFAAQYTTTKGPIQAQPSAQNIIAIDAADYDANVARNNQVWAASFANGHTGPFAMTALDNAAVMNDTGYTLNSPRLDYRVNFAQAGTYYLWVRGIGATADDDSIHAGLDGEALTSADRIASFGTGWTWSKSTKDGPVATIQVTTPGVHTLNLWMREDGFIFDKLVLTTDAAYDPSSAGATGPATSARDTAPITAIPQDNWSLISVDSEELVGENDAAVNAFDGDPATIWHSEWYSANPTPPHTLTLDLGADYELSGFRYLPRQDGEVNGNIGHFGFYVSTDGTTWGSPVATGGFDVGALEKEVLFAPTTGRYVRLVALDEQNGNPWSSVAELNVLQRVAATTPYYTIQSGDTWGTIAEQLYGHIGLGDELQAALGDPALVVGNQISDLPTSLSSNEFYLDQAALPTTYRDDVGRLIGVLDQAGQLTTYSYDSAGNPVQQREHASAPVPALMAQDFANGDYSGLTYQPNGNMIAFESNRVKVTSPNSPSDIFATFHGATEHALSDNIIYRAEVTTDTAGNGEFVGFGVRSGAGNERDHAALFDNGNVDVLYYDGGFLTENIGTFAPNTTYVVEVVTQSTGTTLYVYEKGTDRQSGLIDTRSYADWSSVQTFVQAYGGPGQLGGGVIYLDNVSEATAQGALIGNFIGTESPGDLLTPITAVPDPNYYVVRAGDTWESIAQTLYGGGSAADVLRQALGDPALVAGLKLTGLPASLSNPGAPYYEVQSGQSWADIATALYGTSAVADELQAALGDPALTPGALFTGVPSTITDIQTTTTTVAPYYTVQTGDTWETITQAIYGTSEASAVGALQAVTGNPTLATDLHLTVPATLTYSINTGTTATADSGLLLTTETQTTTVTVPPYYLVQAGDTWETIATALYGSGAVASELQTALGDPALNAGDHLTGFPASLSATTSTTTNYTLNNGALLTTDTQTTTSTVPPYYVVQAGDTWESITQAIYGTSEAAALAALQTATGNPSLTAGLHLTVPASLTYGGGSTTANANNTVLLDTETATTSTTYTLDNLALATTDTQTTTTTYTLDAAYSGGGNSSPVTDSYYDDDGNLIGTLHADGSLTTYQYDSAGNLLGTLERANPPEAPLWYQDFSTDASGFDVIHPGYMTLANGGLTVSTLDADYNWAMSFGTRTYAFDDHVVFRSEVTTGPDLWGTVLDIGAENLDESRRHAAMFNNDGVSAGYFDDNFNYQEASLGQLVPDTTYIVEVVTSDQGSTLYVYEKGTDRNNGFIDVRPYTDWGEARTFFETFSNNGHAETSVRLDNVSEASTVGALVGPWIAVESPQDSSGGGAGSYTIQSGDTWASIAQTLYGTSNVADELQAALGDPPLTAGNTLASLPASLTDTQTTTVTVPPYYVVQAGDTWEGIATTLYGTSNVSAGLQSALGDPALNAGDHLTGLPASLTDTQITTTTVPPYYVVQANDTWDTITQAVYGTSVPEAVGALQTATGNPALTADLHLTVPATLTYTLATTTADANAAVLLTTETETTTVTVPPYYLIQAGDTWTSIATTLYGTSNVAAQLQTALGNPALTAGDHLTGLPASLSDTASTTTDYSLNNALLLTTEEQTSTVTVDPYYIVQAGDTWDSITLALYGTSDPDAVSALQAATGTPALTADLHLTVPTTLSYGGVSATATANSSVLSTTEEQINTINVAPYYVIQGQDTWESITLAVYGTSDPNAVIALQNLPGMSTSLSVDAHLTLPSTLSYSPAGYLTANANASVLADTDLVPTPTAVAPYYVLQGEQTWDDVALAVYGTNAPDVVDALLQQLSLDAQSPVPAAGMHLEVPLHLFTEVQGSANNQTTVTDPLGNTTRYLLDNEGRITEITVDPIDALTNPDGLSLRTVYGYDPDGNVNQITDGNGNATVMEYDTAGNLTLTRDSLGNTVTRTYTTTNQLATETVYRVPDPDGAGAASATDPLTTRYVYDGEEHLRFMVSAEGRVTEYRYAANGNRVSSLGYTTDTYDVTPLAPTDALSESQLLSWLGTLSDLSQIERTDYHYDFRGNIDKTTAFTSTDSITGDGIANGEESITQFVYDQRGRLLQTLDARSSTNTPDPANADTPYATTFVYDGLGRVLNTTQWIEGSTTRSTINSYDDANRTTTVTLANGNGLATTSLYDQRGRLLSVSQADSAQALGTTNYLYDSAGRLRVTIDPIGNTVDYLYDEANRQVAMIDATGALTETVYDGNGNVIETIRYATPVTQANRAALRDVNGDPIDGAALSTALRSTNTNDRHTYNVYDDADRLVFALSPHDTDATKAYVSESQYDGAGRVIEIVQYANPITIPTSRTVATLRTAIDVQLDPANDRHSRSFFDNDGLLTATLDAEGYLCEYRYDAAGQLMETVHYADPTDSSLRATGILDALKQSVLTQGPNTNDQHTHTFYNGKGQVIATLDAEGYLTEYHYDTAGNRTEELRYYQKAKPFTGTEAPSALRPDDTSARSTQTNYNGANQVTDVTTNPQGTVTKYTYNNVGNLIQTDKASNDATETRTTQAVYNARGQVTQELTAEGSVALADLLTQNPGASDTEINQIWSTYGITHTYDPASGRRVSTTDQNGNTTFFYYDAANRLRFTVNAEGEVRETQYDVFGEVTDTIAYSSRISTAGLTGGAIPQPLLDSINNAFPYAASPDTRTHTTYTVRGAVKEMIDGYASSDASTVRYTYNAFGEVGLKETELTSGVFRPDQYDYDRRGLLIQSIEDQGGKDRTTTQTFDAFGRMIQSTDGNQVVRKYDYDRLGREVATTLDPNPGLNLGTVTTYDAFGRVLNQTDARGNHTSYSYNDTARSFTITTEEGIQTVTTQNRHGQTVSIEVKEADGTQRTLTTFAYDRNGNLTKETKGSGVLNLETQHTYDHANRKLLTQDANGTYTRFDYDAANRLITRTVDPKTIDDNVPNGNPSGLNLKTTYEYSGQGRTLTVTEGVGDTITGPRVTKTTYDAKGQVTEVAVDPNGLNLRTTYTFDKAGRTLTMTEGAGTSEARTDQYQYDNLGRRTLHIKDATPGGLNIRCVYEYDQNDNLIRKTEAEGTTDARTTYYAYDNANRLRFTVDALGYVSESLYDDNGNVISAIRYANALNGSVLTQIAGNPGDTASLVTTDPNLTAGDDRATLYVYDKDNRQRYMVDAGGYVTESTYDAAGRVTDTIAYATALNVTKLLTNAGFTSTAIQAMTPDQVRDAVVDILSVDALSSPGVVPGSAEDRLTQQGYDAAGRLSSVTDAAGVVTQYFYETDQFQATRILEAAGTVQERVTRRAYDTAGRLKEETIADGKPEAITQRFGYDALGNQTSLIDPRGVELEQGSSAWAQAERARLNLTTQAYLDLYTSTQAFDKAGRKISATDAIGNTTHTKYDARDNIIKVTDPRGNSGYFYYDGHDKIRYQIDPMGYVTAFDHDAYGNVTEEIHYAKVLTGTYDENTTLTDIAGRLITLADPNDRRTTKDYDVRDLVTDVVYYNSPTNYTEHYDYNAFGEKREFKDKNDAVFNYEYNDRGLISRELSPQVEVVTAVSPTITTQNVRLTNEYEYDAFGNRTVIREAVGLPTQERQTVITYDALDRQTNIEAPSFDVFDPITKTNSSQTPTTEKTYDFMGNVVEEVGPGGHRALNYYDTLNRKVASVDAANALHEYEYDAVGNLIRERTYNTFLTGPLSWQVRPAPVNPAEYREMHYFYNQNNLRIKTETLEEAFFSIELVVDKDFSQGYVKVPLYTETHYDANGQIVKTVEGKAVNVDDVVIRKGNATYYYYDAKGNKILQVDPLGYATGWEYTAEGEVSRQTRYANPLPATTLGNISTTSDPQALLAALAGIPAADRVADADRITEFEYDRMGRKTLERTLAVDYATVDASSGQLNTVNGGNLERRLEYDGNNHLTAQIQPNNQGRLDFFYDALGRQTKQQGATFQAFNGVNQQPVATREETRLQYDAYGRVAVKTQLGQTAAEDRINRFDYDASGNKRSEIDPEGATITYDFDIRGNVLRRSRVVTDVDGNNHTYRCYYSYDAMDRETSRQEIEDEGTSNEVARESQDVKYNAHGDIEAKGINGQFQEQYVYDRLGRLFRTNNENGTPRLYVYDASGNAVLEFHALDNDLTTVDADGVTKPIEGPADAYWLSVGGEAQLTVSLYDARNQLKGVALPPMVFGEFGSLAPTIETSGTQDLPDEPLGDITDFQPDELLNSVVTAVIEPNPDTRVLVDGPIPSESEGFGTPPPTNAQVTYLDIPGVVEGPQPTVYLPPVADEPVPWTSPDGLTKTITEHVTLTKIDTNVEKQSDLSVLTTETTTIDDVWRVTTYQRANITQTLGDNEQTESWELVNSVETTGTRDVDVKEMVTRREQTKTGVLSQYLPGQQETRALIGSVTANVNHVYEDHYNVDYNDPNFPVVFWYRSGTTTVTIDVPAYGSGNIGVEVDGTYKETSQGSVQFSALDSGSHKVRFFKDGKLIGIQTISGPAVTAEGSGVHQVSNSVNVTPILASVRHQVTDLYDLDQGLSGFYVFHSREYETITVDVRDVVGYGDGPVQVVLEAYGNLPQQSLLLNGAGSVQFTRQPFDVYSPTVSLYRGGELVGTIAVDPVITGPSVGGISPEVSAESTTTFGAPLFVIRNTAFDQNLGTPYAVLRLTNPDYSVVDWEAQRNIIPNGSGAPEFIFQSPKFVAGQAFEYLIYNGDGSLVTDVRGHVGDAGVNAFYHVDWTTVVEDATHTSLSGVDSDFGDSEGSSEQKEYVRRILLGLSQGQPGEHDIFRQQEYNAFGEIVKEIDGREFETDLKYNALGKLIEKLDPDTEIYPETGTFFRARPTTRYFYNELGELIATQDPNSVLSATPYFNTRVLVNGRVEKEFDAVDAGAPTAVKKTVYDRLGNRRLEENQVGQQVEFGYDRKGQLRTVKRYAEDGTVYAADPSGFSDVYEYDEAGNRIAHTNALGDRETYLFDGQNRIIRHASFEGQETKYDYQYQASIGGIGGYEKKTTTPGIDTSSNTSIDDHSIDRIGYFGKIRQHVDLDGRVFDYIYNNAGWLKQQQNTASGQNITYEYYGNGYLKEINDYGINSFASFQYDKNGNRTFEGYSQTPIGAGPPGRDAYQLATAEYDELNRLKRSYQAGPMFDIKYNYDANGNRRSVQSTYTNPLTTISQDQTFYYTYDRQNRFLITMGKLDAAGNIIVGPDGYQVAYDSLGRRASVYSEHEDGAGNPVPRKEMYTYDPINTVKETFIYDANGTKIGRTERDNDEIGNLKEYWEYDIDGTTETQIRHSVFDYDRDSLTRSEITQGLIDGDRQRSQYNYFSGTGILDSVQQDSLNANDNNPAPGTATVTLQYRYEKWDSYKESTVNVSGAVPGSNLLNGDSTYTYDVNGHIQELYDRQADRTIDYINNHLGQVIKRYQVDHEPNASDQPPKIRQFYYMNGVVIGDVGLSDNDQALSRVDYAQKLAEHERAIREKTPSRRVIGVDGNGEFIYEDVNIPDNFRDRVFPVTSADFDQNFQPISDTYPARAPQSHVVQSGESLQSIARSMWGDPSLWYMIADANGLRGDEQLVAGTRLTIPNVVANIHNNYQTFRPYDPGLALGDTTPTLPNPPPQDNGCGALGSIIVVVVIIIIAYVTQQYVEGAQVADGYLAASADAGIVGGESVAVYSGTQVATAAAIGAAAGNAAGQIAANAVGLQDGFSGKSVLTAGLSAGATAYLGFSGVDLSNASWSDVAWDAIQRNAISQSAALLTGEQERFSWSSLFVSGFSAPIANEIDKGYRQPSGNGPVTLSGFGTSVAGESLKAATRQAFNVILTGEGEINWGSVAADAFGNAIGNSIVGQMKYDEAKTKVAAPNEPMPQAETPDGVDATRNGDPDKIIDPEHPGTYRVEKVQGRWRVTGATDSVDTDKAAINGILNPPGYAAWLMGQHVDAEFGDDVDKFTLFYNPTEGVLADGWESLRDKLGFTTDVAKQFSNVLQQTQASGRQVEWVAHSQGGIIFSEAVRVSNTDLSNNSVVFHSGGNNEWVTNNIMEDAGVQVIGYRDHPFDPVPNIAGFNTLNPIKILGSVLALPAVIWGGPEMSPHTLPYVNKPSNGYEPETSNNAVDNEPWNDLLREREGR